MTPARQRVPAPGPLEEAESKRLLRWQRRMVMTFVATWGCIFLVIALQVFVRPGDRIIRLALIPVLALVAAGVALQFSARCPRCSARLGFQSSLVVPSHCRHCGVALRGPAHAS